MQESNPADVIHRTWPQRQSCPNWLLKSIAVSSASPFEQPSWADQTPPSAVKSSGPFRCFDRGAAWQRGRTCVSPCRCYSNWTEHLARNRPWVRPPLLDLTTAAGRGTGGFAGWEGKGAFRIARPYALTCTLQERVEGRMRTGPAHRKSPFESQSGNTLYCVITRLGIDEIHVLWLPRATHRKVCHKMAVWTATQHYAIY